MPRRFLVPGLLLCGLLAAAFAVAALLPPNASSAPPARPGPASTASSGAPAVPATPPQSPVPPTPGRPAGSPGASAPGGPVPLDLTRTLPPGSPLPSDAACAAAVKRSSWEPRPENRVANSRTPPAGWMQQPFEGFAREAQTQIVPRVDGAFTGTTDEILQWAACKWGFDVDTVRAQAFTESKWRMSQNGDDGTSWGILQVKPAEHPGTWPWARDSTAYNVDYTLARRRACYEGWSYDGVGTRGDLWGCVGMWYSGSYGTGYSDYVASVQRWYRIKPWRRW
jgi:hypothetical protein